MLNEKFVLGIDLGTSSIKTMALSQSKKIYTESCPVTDITNTRGYSEEEPQEWFDQMVETIMKLQTKDGIPLNKVDAISFSGQMHGLVLLDKNREVLCNSILWNDTRSSTEVQEINEIIGNSEILNITGNKMVEAYLLPKLIWIKKNNPEIWNRINTILLPKDYLKFKITGKINTDVSDATGTGMFDIKTKDWNQNLLAKFDIDPKWLPQISDSVEVIGKVNADFSEITGISQSTIVTSGAADNAAGALGAGVIKDNQLLASIGTSGVILRPEGELSENKTGILQLECAAIKDKYYSMGVTLAAGHSFAWLKKTFFDAISFNEMTELASASPIGSNGLLYAPYISGERTPYFDAKIRGSFTNISDVNDSRDFIRSVMEGITFSLNDIVNIYKKKNQSITSIIAIGGGAHSSVWLQMQADIFNVPIIILKSEQGPSLGAAILASVAANWFETIEDAVGEVVKYEENKYFPIEENVKKYQSVYDEYSKIYNCTRMLEK